MPSLFAKVLLLIRTFPALRYALLIAIMVLVSNVIYSHPFMHLLSLYMLHYGAICLHIHSILKFGVGISNDAKRLQNGFGVPVAGCVDLQHLAVRCGFR